MKTAAAATLVLASLGVVAIAQRMPDQVVVSAPEAPLFVRPDRSLVPLRVARQGSLLRVVKAEGDWYLVEFQDPQFGRRMGYLEAKLVQVLAPEPMDLSISATTTPRATESPSSSASKRRPSPNQTFQKARLNMQVGDDTKSIDVVIRYDTDALVIVQKNSQQPVKTLPYEEMTGGEYSFAKNPRWKTAIFVSPLFLFTSGKKHWFLAQGKNDFALLHLDKENYRLVLAAFETKTGLKVETVADSK